MFEALLCVAGLEGERPARLTRGEADRDTYRRSAVPRECPCCAPPALLGTIVPAIGLISKRKGEDETLGIASLYVWADRRFAGVLSGRTVGFSLGLVRYLSYVLSYSCLALLWLAPVLVLCDG